jgi:hypothetical protein
MKKQTKEIITTTYEDIFVSKDGREFKTEADCKKWEESYECTMEESFANIKKATADAIALGFPNYDAECYILEPKTLDEIVIINAYAKAVCYDVCSPLSADHIGKVIAFVMDYGREYGSFYVMADHIEGIVNYLDKRLAEMN